MQWTYPSGKITVEIISLNIWFLYTYQVYWAPAHMISHLHDYIFADGPKLGLRLFPFVPTIEWGGGGG